MVTNKYLVTSEVATHLIGCLQLVAMCSDVSLPLAAGALHCNLV